MQNEVSRNKLTNKQVVLNLFIGHTKEEELTDAQMLYLRKIRACYGMMLEWFSKNYVMGALISQFSISQSQAYRLYNDAEEIFGSQYKASKEFKRHMAEEMAKEVYRRAKKVGSLGSMIDALHAFIRATGVEREDPDIPDFSKLEPHQIEAVLPQELTVNILETLKAGVINLNNAPVTIDIPHEEVGE